MIIDFDAGYVYRFTDGNGETTCDKLRIESGTLNDRLVIIYHADGMSWSQGLHFKYKNQPETLIMQDEDFFTYEYNATNLVDALAIKNSKTVIDYSGKADSANRQKITVPKSNLECEVLHYSEVVKLFEDAGFTNVTAEGVSVDGSEDVEAGSIIIVSVNGNSVFNAGEEYWSDVPVVIHYRVPLITVIINYYTTNDSETAKLGNTGVYAYVIKYKTYNVYWVIDFDEGYAYTFTDQAGDDYCSKVKITSGTLNDRVTITYHADGISWSQGLFFKYKNQPHILVIQDEDGFTHEYETTSLIDAWKIMDSKTMVSY